MIMDLSRGHKYYWSDDFGLNQGIYIFYNLPESYEIQITLGHIYLRGKMNGSIRICILSNTMALNVHEGGGF